MSGGADSRRHPRMLLSRVTQTADRVICFVANLVNTQHVRRPRDARRHAGDDDELLTDVGKARGLHHLVKLPDHVVRVLRRVVSKGVKASMGIGRRMRDRRRAEVPDCVKVTR